MELISPPQEIIARQAGSANKGTTRLSGTSLPQRNDIEKRGNHYQADAMKHAIFHE